MQTIRSLFLVLAAAFFTLPGAARAAEVAFFPVEGPNLKPEDAIAIGELLAQSYASVSGQTVLAPSRIQLLTPDYPKAAQELKVGEYVRTNAVALGERIVIHAVRYKADGRSVYQSKLTAERIEDLPAISDRMAKSLYNRVDDEEVRTRHNVTLAEARPQSRRWTEKVTGVKTGFLYPISKDATYDPSLTGMFDMRLESDRFFIEFGAGMIIPTGTGTDSWCIDSNCPTPKKEGRIGGLGAELGASYFLTDRNIAPYVGGGVMPRLIFTGEEDDVANLAVYGQLGVTLPRDSSTRFYADLRVSQNVLDIHLDNGYRRLPTELGLNVGIGW